MTILTVGHSTRTMAQLVSLLKTYKANALVDVRRFPRSNTNPQFNLNVIESELKQQGIRYEWMEALGGRRKGIGKDSKNTCWKNLSFRNYADYMETDSFMKSIEELMMFADKDTVAIMCAETLHWRCHRAMISDYLNSKQIKVTHILGQRHSKEHEYTQCAKLKDGNLTYHS